MGERQKQSEGNAEEGGQAADAGALDPEGADGIRGKGRTPEEEGTPTPNPCTTAEPWIGKVGGIAGAGAEPEEEPDEGGKRKVEGGAGGKKPGGGSSEEEEEGTGIAWEATGEERGGTQGTEGADT